MIRPGYIGEEVREDGGPPGAHQARAGDSVRPGPVSSIYRLTGSPVAASGTALEVVHEIREYGCVLRSCADGLQSGGTTPEIIIAVMAWAAQMERLAINERIAGARSG